MYLLPQKPIESSKNLAVMMDFELQSRLYNVSIYLARKACRPSRTEASAGQFLPHYFSRGRSPALAFHRDQIQPAGL
jgi:hypothetical protein